jgi:hypothetical protein
MSFFVCPKRENTNMTHFVETSHFKQMISYSPYVATSTEKKKVKYNLLDGIKEAVGDKWTRFKEGTRQAFDMICFLSAELGFFYAGGEYLAERHDISDRTVRNRLKELEELGQVIKVHRRARKCNGRGKPIYLFVNHPYFTYWVKLLGIDLSNYHTDFQTENAGTPCGSKEDGAKIIPTYLLPSSLNNNHLNIKRIPYIKFVPKSLQHYQAFFGKKVKDLYSRVWLAAKRLNIHSDNYETMQQVGHIAFNWLKLQLKSGNQLTDEQMCKAVYKIALKQLQDRLEEGELYDPSDWVIMPTKAPEPAYKPIERVSIEELDELGVY